MSRINTLQPTIYVANYHKAILKCSITVVNFNIPSTLQPTFPSQHCHDTHWPESTSQAMSQVDSQPASSEWCWMSKEELNEYLKFSDNSQRIQGWATEEVWKVCCWLLDDDALPVDLHLSLESSPSPDLGIHYLHYPASQFHCKLLKLEGINFMTIT